MAASSGISGFGTLFSWGGSDIAELTNITGPGESAGTIDITNHDSDDGYEEFVAGIRSGGDISIEGNFISTDTTGQIALHTDFQAGSKKTWIIKHPAWVASSHEYPQISGSGIVTAFSMGAPYNDKLSFSATIKVSGKPTLTVTA